MPRINSWPFHRLLPAVILSTPVINLNSRIRENSSGQTNFKFVFSFPLKISLPKLSDQAEREVFAVETALIRFRFILDLTALNHIVISDSALTQFGNLSLASVD